MDYGGPLGCKHCNPEEWEALEESDRQYKENMRLYGVPYAYGPGLNIGEADHMQALLFKEAIDKSIIEAVLNSLARKE